MSKEITKANILQEIENKFSLRELTPEKFRFSEEVVPTYDVGQHLKKWLITHATISITSGPAAYGFFGVPSTEKWKIRGYNIVFMASGAYTVTGAFIRRGAAIETVYLDMKEGQTVSYAVNLPEPVILEPGDGLSIYIDSYTSTADLRLYIDCQKETLR